MSRAAIYILISLVTTAVYARSDSGIYDELVLSAYQKACDLNDSKDYLEAYRHIVSAEKMIDSIMTAEGLSPSMLSADDFRYPYWAVRKSRAEIAYMVGLHDDMAQVSASLQPALQSQLTDGGIPQSVADAMWAELAKIDGGRLYLTGDYDLAEKRLLTALQKGDFFGNDHFVCRVHDDLAQVYYIQGLYDRALARLDTILTYSPYREDSRFAESQPEIMRIRSQRAICLARMGKYDEALQEIGEVLLHIDRTTDRCLYAEVLRKKAKILMMCYDDTGRYDQQTPACYRDYLAVSRDYIDSRFVAMSRSEREQYWMAEYPFVTDCFLLEDKDPGLLYDVALFSKAILLQVGRSFTPGMSESVRRDALKAIRVSWRHVRERMSDTDCAIEFMVYEKSGEEHLGAVVISGSDAPAFIHIAKVSDITGHILPGGLPVRQALDDTGDRDKINSLYSDSTLCSIIWSDDLTQLIGSHRNIYFSPDGILHRLAIEYMAPVAIRDRHFYRLSSTRLLAMPQGPFATATMLRCGGIEYAADTGDSGVGNDEAAYSLLAPMRLYLPPLPQSSAELDSICAVRSAHAGDIDLRADTVTEDIISRLAGKYDIVHLSTHGMFCDADDSGTDIRPAATDRQLSGSSLFLSGAESNLHRPGFDPSGHDGILSAREIAGLDMSGVSLAVLPACMSGLGYITPDGVYGLQRGLKAAGVKSIISTLWSVDDEATRLFIVSLYRNLEAGLPLQQAFIQARESLMHYDPAASASDESDRSFARRRRINFSNDFNRPYFYNAFILIDGI